MANSHTQIEARVLKKGLHVAVDRAAASLSYIVKLRWVGIARGQELELVHFAQATLVQRPCYVAPAYYAHSHLCFRVC